MNTSRSSLRLTWTEVWSTVACVVGDRSLCTRDQVGAVIVDSTNRIIATAYNGPPAGFSHGDLPCDQWCARSMNFGTTVVRSSYKLDPSYEDCLALHAEANALAVCDRRDREGGTIYVASDVCWSCAKLIANSGLKYVIAASRGRRHRNSERSYDFLRSCGVEVDTINVEDLP